MYLLRFVSFRFGYFIGSIVSDSLFVFVRSVSSVSVSKPIRYSRFDSFHRLPERKKRSLKAPSKPFVGAFAAFLFRRTIAVTQSGTPKVL